MTTARTNVDVMRKAHSFEDTLPASACRSLASVGELALDAFARELSLDFVRKGSGASHALVRGRKGAAR